MSSIAWTDRETVGIDLYRTDDYVLQGRADLFPLLRSVLGEALGRSLDDALFALSFHQVADQRETSGDPVMVNLRPSHSYLTIRILVGDRLIYRHPHSVREVFARPLQRLLAADFPDEKHWGYAPAGPGLEKISLERPAPRMEGTIDVRLRRGRASRLNLEEVAEPEPPLARLADLGVPDPGEDGLRPEDDVAVVFAPEAGKALRRELPLSEEIEEGGFLVGYVHRDADHPERCLVEVVHALPAERTGASMLQFTFTGESFLRANDAVHRLGGDLQLVGWYHTHLFPATERLGLSSSDVELHSRTFRRRWQIAGLLNLDDGERVLRAYGWNGRRMRRLPQWVVDG
ncbi:JAB N-terminal domain-containing protein [Actinoplanes sp. NPDC051513]|uniref:JAB N-terminal domain-containing protein n=1 Tax=Actinoplanes sp. NPDC051513 TaxID=3363908 RepID=UPI00378DB75C